MTKSANMQKLIDLGLSQREARVYLVLLKKSVFTATELAKVSGIPRQKIYDILDGLVRRGICAEKVGKIKRYKATAPESATRGLLEQYRNDFESEMLAREKLARDLSRNLARLYERNQARVDPLEYITMLRDRQQILRHWKSLQDNAKQEILSFNKAPFAAPFAENIDDETAVLKRNVKIRAIYESEVTKNAEYAKALSLWVAAGEEARLVKELPMKLNIYDEQITMVPLADPISLTPSLTAMIINHAGFAKAQKAVFESYWERAIPYENFKTTSKTKSK
jgi:sugar-specific transcriptional regulator TrmB